MQIDMHYYGTYCLARAAGLKKDATRTIAYAAQFVDDNVAKNVDDHEDGSKIIAVPTAHHPGDIKNRDPEDQRYIWVPFHFLPGNEGVSWTERLVCRKDSKIAQDMIQHHISQHERVYAYELLGIGAHTYMDTFAHYGFSGVSSRRNRIDGDSLKLEQSDEVITAVLGKTFSSWSKQYGGLVSNIRSAISGAAEIYSGSLGHGAVSSYPDLPFLKWQFTYEQTGNVAVHDNPATFLECSEKMYRVFRKFGEIHPEAGGDPIKEWESIRDHIEWILAQVGNKMERANVWQASSESGRFSVPEVIPEYNSDKWNEQADRFPRLHNSSLAKNMEVHRFFRAAAYHRLYILREVLPSHGIIVV